jgi:Skp family chaperone for outer membrane proteins
MMIYKRVQQSDPVLPSASTEARSAARKRGAALLLVLFAGLSVEYACSRPNPAGGGTAGQAAPGQPPQGQPSPTASAPAPIPPGATFAYINFQRIATESVAGKASQQKLDALIKSKESEGAAKSKQLQASQTKLQGGGVTDQARTQLLNEINRQQVDLQNFEQSAQAQLSQFQQQMQTEFMQKLNPVFAALAAEKKVQILFNTAADSIAWADPSLDFTDEAIRRLDAASPPAGSTAKP